MSAHTIKLGTTDSACPLCEGEGQEHFLEARIEMSASGFAQMLVQFCPTHGPVKRLYSSRPDDVFKALYPEFFKDQFPGIIEEPKPTKWE